MECFQRMIMKNTNKIHFLIHQQQQQQQEHLCCSYGEQLYVLLIL